jgi:hypothetical protein
MDLVWPSIKFVPAGKYVVSVRSHGPWFVIHSLYAYSVSLTGLGIAAKALTTKRLYFRKRAALLLVGVSVPIAAELFYILRPIPGLVKDFTPIAYAISASSFSSFSTVWTPSPSFPSRGNSWSSICPTASSSWTPNTG